MARLDRKGPVLKYGVLIIGVILWYALIWNPIATKVSELEEENRSKEARIERLDKTIKRLKDVDKRLQRARERLNAAKRDLVPGDDPQLVASNLQNLLLKKASEHGIEVITYKTGPMKKWKGHDLAVVAFTLKTNTRSLVEFLQKLNADRELFRIRTMNIVKIRGRDSYLRARLEFEALCL